MNDKKWNGEDYAIAGSIWFLTGVVFIIAGIFSSAFVMWGILSMFVALFLFMVGLFEKNK